MMNKMYPLEWFDSLILQTFSPKKADIKKMSEQDLSNISENISSESKKIQIQLKNEVFSIRKKRQVRLLVRNYHFNLVFLLDTVIKNQGDKEFKDPSVSGITAVIVINLEELISFIEERFSSYLSLNERVPITYHILSKNELFFKIGKLKEKWMSAGLERELLQIVIQKVFQSVKSFDGTKITYRHILYWKELLKSLEGLEKVFNTAKKYTILDEILIGLNFNCIEYVNYFTDRITDVINEKDELQDKLNILLLYYKEFNQLQSNEKISFDAAQQHIKYALDNWFEHEVLYLERQITLELQTKNSSDTGKFPINIELNNKIECMLSTDQMGLILRATDESRIVKARSMSLVFKTIIPYLSTPFKKDLSYQSVRSKSYNAEERDKEIAIQTLEKIIKKIRTY